MGDMEPTLQESQSGSERDSLVGEQERRQELIDALDAQANELCALEAQAQQAASRGLSMQVDGEQIARSTATPSESNS